MRKRPYYGAQLRPLSLCGLQTAPRHILNTHEHFHVLPFTTLQQFTILLQGWLETESTKTGCTLSQERRIKHACLMLQPPLLQLSVAQNLLAEQEVVLDQDGRLLLPTPSLCRPGRGRRLCGGCCRVSWKLQHTHLSIIGIVHQDKCRRTKQRNPKLFFVSSTTSTVSTTTVCYLSSTAAAACGKRKRQDQNLKS